MTQLIRASQELFRRTPDECFSSLSALVEHCQRQQDESRELWQPSKSLDTRVLESGRLLLQAGDDALEMNDWSFQGLCRLASVSKDTVNRLTPVTAAQVLRETLPRGQKPLQLFAAGTTLRAIHGTSYTRLHNTELLGVIQEYATDFEPPQPGLGGATGLYAGEQDAFVFLIDPAGWTEIEGEPFAPGCFVWNSEVGRRSLGIQTFWFQAVCRNHVVWDAIEVVDYSRKHTANVHDSLNEIRRILEALVVKRDARRDGFVQAITKAMHVKLGDDADEVQKVLVEQGITRTLIKEALQIAQRQGAFTIFSLVDALTRITRDIPYAGQRAEMDQKVAQLLALAA